MNSHDQPFLLGASLGAITLYLAAVALRMSGWM
jgi:hypothetical protein